MKLKDRNDENSVCPNQTEWFFVPVHDPSPPTSCSRHPLKSVSPLFPQHSPPRQTKTNTTNPGGGNGAEKAIGERCLFLQVSPRFYFSNFFHFISFFSLNFFCHSTGLLLFGMLTKSLADGLCMTSLLVWSDRKTLCRFLRKCNVNFSFSAKPALH